MSKTPIPPAPGPTPDPSPAEAPGPGPGFLDELGRSNCARVPPTTPPPTGPVTRVRFPDDA